MLQGIIKFSKNVYEKNTDSNKKNPTIISYIQLRRAVGSLGIALPVVLVLGSFLFGSCVSVKPSISDYYYTNMREIFVGILCAISLFLFSYRGYSPMDNWSANIAGFFALGIAFFPTQFLLENHCESDVQNFVCLPSNSTIHFTSAALFFLTLAYMSIFLFTISKPQNNDKSLSDILPKPTKQKLLRNKIYVICGIMIIVSLLVIFLYQKNIFTSNLPITFIFESIALFAFGFSWLVKGETLFGDK